MKKVVASTNKADRAAKRVLHNLRLLRDSLDDLYIADPSALDDLDLTVLADMVNEATMSLSHEIEGI